MLMLDSVEVNEWWRRIKALFDDWEQAWWWSVSGGLMDNLDNAYGGRCIQHARTDTHLARALRKPSDFVVTLNAGRVALKSGNAVAGVRLTLTSECCFCNNIRLGRSPLVHEGLDNCL